jgi:hypothetical protein
MSHVEPRYYVNEPKTKWKHHGSKLFKPNQRKQLNKNKRRK